MIAHTGNGHLRCLIVVALAALAGGCLHERVSQRPLDLGVDPQTTSLQHSAAFRDTIGAYTYFEGLTAMKVRGYGLVVGLGTSGSRDCPRNVYDRLVQRLYKRHHFSESEIGVASVSPEQMIQDLNTAVVIIQGSIPPAAVRGTRFDVAVAALPGTETKSLHGGRLFTTDLDVYRPLSQGVSIVGRTLAIASGPLFFNPFSEGQAATASMPLEGTLVGGGVVMEDRRIRLVLVQASYRIAQRIQDRINAHFPGPHRVADAVSPSFIQLRVPEEYHHDTAHFLALVRSLYLSRDPKFEVLRVKELTAELAQRSAPHARIALALEGVGRTALPALDDLYTNPHDWISFHAAAAGLRLADHLAVDAMAVHARDANCPFRFRAIRGLAVATDMAGAAIALRRLLHDKDPRVQAEAYEGLLRRRDVAIRSLRIGDDNFVLDQIPTDGPAFVYVKRSGSRRIALFGSDLICTPPVLYVAPDGSLTITADEGDERLTLLRRVSTAGALSPRVQGPLELSKLIELIGDEAAVDADDRPIGLGVDYAGVVRLLYHLCRDNAIDAQFILEQPKIEDVLGPVPTTTRPESDL